jgi:hypothetical protein
MGLPKHHSGKGRRSAVAETVPLLKVITTLIRHLIIEFFGSEKSRARPAVQIGAELVYIISDTRPSGIDQLIHSVFVTRSPLYLEFSEKERGKTVWFAVRWENTHGEKGPWSDIYYAIILLYRDNGQFIILQTSTLFINEIILSLLVEI